MSNGPQQTPDCAPTTDYWKLATGNWLLETRDRPRTMTPRPKAWIAWSSGKDSAWALHAARQQGEYDVVGMLTTITEPYHRVSMHGVRTELLEAQARATELPLHRVLIPAPCSNEQYEAAMAAAMQHAQADGISCMIFGDLFLEDVRNYRLAKLAPTGIAAAFPVWGRDTQQLAREMVDAGLRAHVTCLDPRKLSREFAGRIFDAAFLDELPEGVDPCGEYGEFHTFAFAGPMFRAPIQVAVGETVEREGFVFTDVFATP